jgi:type II secretory pathway component PulF
MTPEKLEKIMKLQTPMGATTPKLLVIFSTILIIPALMIFLSVFLKPQLNKWLNIIIAFLYACISILIIVSSFGNEWQLFFVIFNIIELVVFIIIMFQAWKWPRVDI